MSINKQAYSAIETIVGGKYISEDPAIMEGYRSGPGGYENGTGYERVMTTIPHAVVMPKNTEEVQKIIKICNRYNVPYVPYSTGFYGPRTHCHVENELIIDLKRYKDFEYDDKHFYFDVGSGAILAPLQQEALNKGAYTVIGGGGAQCSAICNLIGDGWSPLSHRIGLPHRRILGTELVLPDGELVKTGSLATSDDPFWGEGPGPDLRGILRGFTGLRGCMGIVTKMAIKTLPFQPEPLVPTGIAPNTALALPVKRVKWLNFRVPTKEAQIKAMFDIGQAEIAAALTKVPLFWRAIAKAEDKEEFWDIWLKETEESIANFFIVRVLLVGYTSEDDMIYQENVLNDIMTELGGVPMRTKPSDESWIKNADSAGMWLMTGSYVSVDYIIESLTQATVHGNTYAELKKKYTPPLMPDFGDPGWFQSFELGHQGYSEFLIYWDHREDTSGVDQFYVDTSKMNIKHRYYTSLIGPHQPLFLTGPNYGPNYHEWLLKLKNEFDPKWVSHPPVPLAHDDFVNKAPWMHAIRDWEFPEELPMPKW
ncbi:MAG: GlcD [Firmicutes bacterium]|nr:GlcD [Bacillota bacterium]